MASALPPRVYTIPPSANFLATLVDALVGGRLVPGPPLRDDPLALADATIFVPTRRAGRALAAAITQAACLLYTSDAADEL